MSPIMDGMGCTKKWVVIVGGGIAGGLLAKSLQDVADVVLIDPKEYFEIPWANLRAAVEPSFAERSVINHSDYFKGHLVVSSAVNLSKSQVVTEEGHVVEYDYLIIATGHAASVPRSRKDRLEQFQEGNQKIKSSNSILIIGGGPSGVELAAEIAEDFPGKKVTLVQSRSRLLKFVGPKASSKAQQWLESKNVNVLLDQSIDLEALSEGGIEFVTSTGETIKADCYFDCTGRRRTLGSSWLRDTFLKDCLNRRGELIVDENLRVLGQSNIFAIGDITDIIEIKQGCRAQRHATVVAKNVKLLMRGASNTCLHKYKPRPHIAMVTLGRKDAVTHTRLLTMAGSIPGIVKSRDLFVGRTRKQMGL